MKGSLWCVSKERTWEPTIIVWESDPLEHKEMAVTQFKADCYLFTYPYQQSYPQASKCMEITIKKPKRCVHLRFDIVHRMGIGTDLRRYCNYIIGRLPLLCILMQVLEASTKHLWFPGIWARQCMTSVSGHREYVIVIDIEHEQDQIKGAHSSLQGCVLCACASENELAWAPSVSNVSDYYIEPCKKKARWLTQKDKPKVHQNPLLYTIIVIEVTIIWTQWDIISEQTYWDWKTHDVANCRSALGCIPAFPLHLFSENVSRI